MSSKSQIILEFADEVEAEFPTRSNVAVAALRNLDGVPGGERLVELLSRIDDIAERQETSPS